MELDEAKTTLQASQESSTSSEPCSPDDENFGHPLHPYVLAEIAQHMTVETLMAARLVNKDWNAACSKEFRKKVTLVANLTFEKSVDKFIDTFNPNSYSKLLTESLWIRKPKFLKNPSMVKWIEESGTQIKSAKLGKPMNELDIREDIIKTNRKVFSPELISTFLNNCPNLKSLYIVNPFSATFHSSFKPTAEGTVALDYLEIGSVENTCGSELDYAPDLPGSSSFLLNLLKCLKSLKILKIVKTSQFSFDGIKHFGNLDEYGKSVLEKVTELIFEGCKLDPRQLFGFPAPNLQFQNLRKLSMASFCECDEYSQEYLPALFSSLSSQLEELIFEACSSEFRMICPKLEECFPPSTTMSKLEVFKILGITLWKYPSLKFLKRLPKLKILHMTTSMYWIGVPGIDHIFQQRISKLTVYHKGLKELHYRCWSNTPNVFSGIVRRFPNLETLEADFDDMSLKPVFSVLGKLSRIKNLKLYISDKFLECNYFKVLASSGIEKLSLEYWLKCSGDKLRLSLDTSVNLDCFKSTSLQELNFIGMKFDTDEYKLLMKKLSNSKAKLKLRLIECDLKIEPLSNPECDGCSLCSSGSD